MPTPSWFRIAYLSFLSQPDGDRLVYRQIRRQRAQRILELGIGDGRRARRMIEVARCHAPPGDVCYTGLDLFEARISADGPGMTLKLAHRHLGATGARIRLVPGNPFSALAQTANVLGQVDIIVVSSLLEPQSLAKAWFYVPRLLHERSQVFLQERKPGNVCTTRPVDRSEIATFAASAVGLRAA